MINRLFLISVDNLKLKTTQVDPRIVFLTFLLLLIFFIAVYLINRIHIYREKAKQKLSSSSIQKNMGESTNISPRQTKEFLQVMKKYDVKTNHRFLESVETVKGVFRKLFELTEKDDRLKENEHKKETQKLTLYRFLQKIDLFFHKKVKINNTFQLKQENKVNITRLGTESVFYETKVHSVNPSSFTILLPESIPENQVIKGQGIELVLPQPVGEVYSVNTTVERITIKNNLIRGRVTRTRLITLSHSKKVSLLFQKKHRRYTLKARCMIHPLIIVRKQQGFRRKEKKVKQFAIQGIMSKVIDISASGCCLQNQPHMKKIRKRMTLKVLFNLDGKSIQAVGRITGFDRSFIHLQFTAINTVSMNQINRVIYDPLLNDKPEHKEPVS